MDLHPVVFLGRQGDLAVGHLPQDLEELAGRDRHAARLHHLRLIMPANADFEVGRDKLDPILFRLQQNVRERRHRVAFLDDTLDALKASQ